MPSLDQNKIMNSYIISLRDDLSFKFDSSEIDSIIKASLSIKKNILLMKKKNTKIDLQIDLQNDQKLINNSEFLFIPHRLKKQFKTMKEYTE